MYKMKEIRRAIRRDRDLRGMVVKSGAKDAILLDVTEDKMPDIALLDTTGDGYVDAVALDLDGNGYFDTLLADTDGNDVPDTVILGDLDNGTIREVIRGEDVEDAIIDAVNLIVSAVMLDLFTAAAADALAEEVCADVSCEETVCTGAVSAPDFRTGDSPMKSAAAMANTVMATATPVF